MEVARAGIIGNVALEEDDLVALRGQRPDETPPKRRMSVPPG
jgi:hypothetical protein